MPGPPELRSCYRFGMSFQGVERMVVQRYDAGGEGTQAAVRDYFAMLEAEMRGRGHAVGQLARRWSRAGPDEAGRRRFQHVSAILIEHGLPYLDRFKPLSGYTQAQLTAVERYLRNHVDVLRLMEADVDRPVVEVPDTGDRDLEEIFRAAPHPGEVPDQSARPEDSTLLAGIDYLGREQRNRSLASAGEALVMDVERRRLVEAGCEVLADNLEHVSGEYGEALGYDIRSYEVDGRERLIQVKTTRFRKETPFYVSANEVAVSGLYRERYWIYRVYGFRDTPCLYHLNGPLSERFRLEPREYRATVR